MDSHLLTVPRYRLGDFSFDPGRRQLSRDGVTIPLPARALATLEHLITNRNRIVTKEELMEAVWPGMAVGENNLNQSISALRKALGDTRRDGRWIATIPNTGYQFVGPVEAQIDESTPPAPPRVREPIWRRIAIGFGLTAIAAFALLAPTGLPKKPAVAILAFQNLSQDENVSWLSLALPEILARHFAANPNARVILPALVDRAVNELTLSGLTVLGPAEWKRLAVDLGADALIAGSYTPSGGRLTLHVDVIDPRREQTYLSADESGDFDQFLTLAVKAGERVGTIWSGSGTGKTGLPARAEPMRLYAEGLAKWRNADLPAAQSSLRQAAALDAENPLILAALARTMADLGYSREAGALARRAAVLAAGLTPAARLEVDSVHWAVTGAWEKAIEARRRLFALNPDSLEDGLQLAGVLVDAGHPADAQEVLGSLSKLPGQAATDPRIPLLRARTFGISGEMERVREWAHRAADFARARGAQLIYARARLLEAGAMQNLNTAGFQEARTEARETCEALRDRNCVAASWRMEGNYWLTIGKGQEAERCYQKAMVLVRQTGRESELVNLLNGLASAAVLRRDFQAAEATYREALALVERRAPHLAGGLLNGLADVFRAQGKLPAAADSLQQALALAVSQGDHETAGRAHASLAEIYDERRESSRAAASYQKALAELRIVKNPEPLTRSLAAYSRFVARTGPRAQAATLLAEAERATPSGPVQLARYFRNSGNAQVITTEPSTQSTPPATTLGPSPSRRAAKPASALPR